ncbi:hypothetical protein F9C07_6454 [Aspergillus flavus]|uniref:Uncharacterized protein n=1 Tax=Aspergillus flavus (strain ATCC 200026 / FGSC A1120 / IAM 13836 / NRRL 3357 / JCM 12722 / SRRC 167) TaxID=332952 RepID=A0A7U2MHR9_ASPFN|nr:hypothetical protein F9C07_6454 [Aspergillus flavus]
MQSMVLLDLKFGDGLGEFDDAPFPLRVSGLRTQLPILHCYSYNAENVELYQD